MQSSEKAETAVPRLVMKMLLLGTLATQKPVEPSHPES